MAVTSAPSWGFPPTESQPFSGCDTMTTQNVLSDWQKTQQAPMPGTCLRLGGYTQTRVHVHTRILSDWHKTQQAADAEDLLEVGGLGCRV